LRSALIAALWVTVLAAKSTPVDGIVIAVDPAARTMLVAHRPIGKYMEAMTMPFRVEDVGQLTGLHPGARVQFDLVVEKDHSFARNVHKYGSTDTPVAAPKEQLAVGAKIPDFQLTDQSGRVIQNTGLRGKVAVVDFIYTRCPLPDICPRLSANFAALQRKFQPRLGTDLVLLSITVDPDYDTPQILAAYARRWAADNRGWYFLTGEVSKIAAALGEVYWTDEGSIGHNSMTSIIGRDGKLSAMVDGASWRVDQLEELVQHELEHQK